MPEGVCKKSPVPEIAPMAFYNQVLRNTPRPPLLHYPRFCPISQPEPGFLLFSCSPPRSPNTMFIKETGPALPRHHHLGNRDEGAWRRHAKSRSIAGSILAAAQSWLDLPPPASTGVPGPGGWELLAVHRPLQRGIWSAWARPGELSAFSRTARGPHAVAAATVGRCFGFARATSQCLYWAGDQALPSLAMAMFWGLERYNYCHQAGNKIFSKCYLCYSSESFCLCQKMNIWQFSTYFSG